ncbi:MAG: hypothetical protein EAZ60_11905 [Oscillatoriales cyanobacterium]|nr:MAG: hypothetical protein EAZ83_01695 [Oscillatoriales cyanobacterium]TAF23405.1 MAG: hypothetical protein EAZ73_02035 [Oscillatoriales cyanobacterium]TAF30447.1 MAG: hypothetical protein EAZ69_22525 [Oscillatoriales cyanobacterium]TAF55789.1 MAG: hypothetical protein EAZ60_11905 [Oscillatoriales cyanobacterium]
MKLSEIAEIYREQVRLFLTSYPEPRGRKLAKRYLQLVTSPEYGKTSGRQVHKPANPSMASDIDHKYSLSSQQKHTHNKFKP